MTRALKILFVFCVLQYSVNSAQAGTSRTGLKMVVSGIIPSCVGSIGLLAGSTQHIPLTETKLSPLESIFSYAGGIVGLGVGMPIFVGGALVLVSGLTKPKARAMHPTLRGYYQRRKLPPYRPFGPGVRLNDLLFDPGFFWHPGNVYHPLFAGMSDHIYERERSNPNLPTISKKQIQEEHEKFYEEHPEFRIAPSHAQDGDRDGDGVPDLIDLSTDVSSDS